MEQRLAAAATACLCRYAQSIVSRSRKKKSSQDELLDELIAEYGGSVFGSAANLNLHAHAIVLDAVFAEMRATRRPHPYHGVRCVRPRHLGREP